MHSGRAISGFTASAAALVLALSACAPHDTSDGRAGNYLTADSLAEEVGGDAPSEPVTDDQAGQVSIDAIGAIDAALAQWPGAVVDVELEQEDGTLIWEVTVLKEDGMGRQIALDASTAKLLEDQSTRLTRIQNTVPGIPAAEVISMAMAVADGQVVSVELDTEQRTVVWEIELLTASGSTDVYIDAATGKIVEHQDD